MELLNKIRVRIEPRVWSNGGMPESYTVKSGRRARWVMTPLHDVPARITKPKGQNERTAP
jgi:hypothetical protein